jgi:hypothetical protein
MKQSLPEEAGEMEDLLRQAGIDPRKDFDEIAFALFGAPEKASDFAMLAKGRIVRAKVEQVAVAQGAKKQTLGAIPVLLLPSEAGDADAPTYLSFLGDLMVAGTAEGTRRVHGGPGPKGASLSSRATADVPAGAALWFVADLTRVKAPAATAENPVASALKKVAFWMELGDGMDLQAVAQTADAQSAAQAAGLVQMLAGMAAAQTAGPEGSPLAGLSVKADGTSITAALSLSKAQLDQLKASAAAAAEAAAAAPVTPPADAP